MAQMKNAPIRYVIGVVRFPEIADFDTFVKEMARGLAAGYPAGKEAEIPQINVHIDERGVQVQSEVLRIWQFRSEDFKWSAVVNKGMIALHTTGYIGHEDFLRRLVEVAEVAVKTESSQVRMVEGVALRYLDLVEPKEDDVLEQYLHERFMPVGIDVGEFALREGVNQLQMGTEAGGALRLQVARRPPSVFPPDLNSQLIVDNNWQIDRPREDFVTIDADHSLTYVPPRKIDLEEMRGNIVGLWQPIRDIFDKITTEHAMKVWK
ncbi:TIGR04255 family protein [Rhizobium sp. WSM1325]|uniref:TIGR04255 family protein n=1 Tax=Rhizobium sp. WSM1325 TaxID=3444086 RepID=UPI000FF0274A|nr:TIGR04255 family protein [Rhizobium leguminosarum]RWY70030.1 TIGR04255 family protein [Rhizobium leguminosarum]